MIADRLEAVAQALARTHTALRQLAAGTAVIAALQGDWRRFGEALQKAGTLDLQLEGRDEALAVIETLSMIAPILEVDRKAIGNAAAVRLTLLKPQTLNERSVDYDPQGRIVKITDTPVTKGKLKIECFAHHTVLREDNDDGYR